jgi:hypothetical protein
MRRWTEDDMDGTGEGNGEIGDVSHPFTVGLDFDKWKFCEVRRDMSGGVGRKGEGTEERMRIGVGYRKW